MKNISSLYSFLSRLIQISPLSEYIAFVVFVCPIHWTKAIVNMQAQPLRTVPFVDSEKGQAPQNSWEKEWEKMDERKKSTGDGSLSIKLGLGNSNVTSVTNPANDVFTRAQLHELEHQFIILKYISAGLAVPLHLIRPIWKSVTSSFSAADGGIYHRYPSFIGFSPQGFDYRNMTMDPEPGRCRRTDGKKWRCGKDVIPNQKYCERHVHRGSQRSRKHVEAPNASLTFTNSPIILNEDLNVLNTASCSVSAPTGLRIMRASSTFITTTTPASASSNNENKCKNEKNCDEENDEKNVKEKSNMERSSNTENNKSVGSHVLPGVGLSPKSVLQVPGISPCLYYSSRLGPEQGRCRRTDGKKWRCSKDVVPNQKYCPQHMHRGAKKQHMAEATQPVTAQVLSGIKGTNSTKQHGRLSTNLSIAVPASAQLVIDDQKMKTSSSGSGNSNITHSSVSSP